MYIEKPRQQKLKLIIDEAILVLQEARLELEEHVPNSGYIMRKAYQARGNLERVAGLLRFSWKAHRHITAEEDD